MSSRVRSDVLAGIAAVVALLLLVFLFRLPIWLSIPVAVVIYIAVRFAIPPPKEVVPGMTRADVNQVIRQGEGKAGQIRSLAQSIPKAAVRSQVLRIANTVDNIYADFQQDPKDIAQVPDFAGSYLDPLINVLDRYVRLADRPIGPQGNQTLATIEHDVLPQVETNFSGIYQQLVNDDVVDLEAASAGLKALVDLGGSPG